MEAYFDGDRAESSGLRLKGPLDAKLLVGCEPATAQLEHADFESAYRSKAGQSALGYPECVSMGLQSEHLQLL